jgi:hypothetical protein
VASPGRFAEAVLLALTALALCLMAQSAGAEAPVLARILAIDSERVTLSVEPHQPGVADALVLAVSREALTSGMEVGALVRLWPGSSLGLGAGDILIGARLEPLDGGLATRDRTGVRARLMYGGQRGLSCGMGSGRGGGAGGR